MSQRLALPNRRNHITQKVPIAGRHTLHLSVHDDEQPAEFFLRVKGADCSSKLIGLYDVVARLISLALQYGAPLEQVGDLIAGAKFAPCGAVSGHDRIKSCTRLPISLAGICWWSTAAIMNSGICRWPPECRRYHKMI